MPFLAFSWLNVPFQTKLSRKFEKIRQFLLKFTDIMRGLSIFRKIGCVHIARQVYIKAPFTRPKLRSHCVYRFKAHSQGLKAVFTPRRPVYVKARSQGLSCVYIARPVYIKARSQGLSCVHIAWAGLYILKPVLKALSCVHIAQVSLC